ncbi:MAG TPA: 50S ribosomal protein L13 [bacterium]|nr:50S ribosomal protein L13 [bacterium]HPQ67186.1 50S ribosomal protein L13 [bacterium]
MKTYSAKPEEMTRTWYLVDAEGQVLGRLATRIADILRGKNKPIFTPHVDTGDFVVVVNAEKVVVTGRKSQQMEYQRYSGYPGGLKSVPYKTMLKNHPERIIEHAVKGMVPHNRLGRQVLKKLKVYAGPAHPHEAQHPEPLVLD